MATALTYYVKPSGNSKVTVWSVNKPLLGRGHYKKERASRFKVRIISNSGKVLVDKIVTGKSNSFSGTRVPGTFTKRLNGVILSSRYLVPFLVLWIIKKR